MKRSCFALLGLLGLGALVAPRADAQETLQPPAKELGLSTYAIVVGSNPGGPGQSTLRYAERDAERVADLLQELGRTPQDQVTLLRSPTSADLAVVLHEAEQKLAASRSRGQQTRLVFYYSGHARSQALNLGSDEVSLSTLRQQLLDMPASLTLVMLDACQSGAVSGVKGAEPASDFSHNTLRSLSTEGVAIMASSSSTELSQESDAIQGSYFTHHLIMAMRGAGDRNGDARVSLDEAYRYAYEHTLADTSQTAVGGQHVTLETDLRGQGDIPLSYPVDASAHLLLPAPLSGQLLVQQPNAGSVMAELHKAKGTPLSLALPPGTYDATLRDGEGSLYRCQLTVPDGQNTSLDLNQCDRRADLAAGQTKGGAQPGRNEGERFFVEIGFSLSRDLDDRYVKRLVYDFGLAENAMPRLPILPVVRLGWMVSNYVGAHAEYRMLEYRDFDRLWDDVYFTFHTHALTLGGRARLPFADDWLAIGVFAGVGPTLTFSDYTGATDTQLGWMAQVGLHLELNMGIPGLFAELGYAHAPGIENLLGNVHNSGGLFFTIGARLRERGNR